VEILRALPGDGIRYDAERLRGTRTGSAFSPISSLVADVIVRP